jgi:hypothetical protein
MIFDLRWLIIEVKSWRGAGKGGEGFCEVIIDPNGPCSDGELSSRIVVGVETTHLPPPQSNTPSTSAR